MSSEGRSRAVEGRVALVTGASQGGIGTAIAVRLAAEGALLAISGRSQRGLDDCREQIRATGGVCAVLPADLADPDGARSTLVGDAERALGPVEILVNNAALTGYTPFLDGTRDEVMRHSG